MFHLSKTLHSHYMENSSLLPAKSLAKNRVGNSTPYEEKKKESAQLRIALNLGGGGG